MMSEPSSVPMRHFLYNPLRQDPQELERLFVARRSLFARLHAEITSQEPNTVPSHHLLIGQRGMGKTTMLARLALELRKKHPGFLPLSFWEEQHVEVDRLSVFWLNCLDSYADACEQADGKATTQALDAQIQAIQSIKPEDECARAARDAFAEVVQRDNRRLVLFIDNFNLLLVRLKEHDHALRSFFTKHGAPIIISAAVTPPTDIDDYDAAFYDGFKTTVLDRLTLEETKDMIISLAKEQDQHETINNLWSNLPRLSALRDLSGGNPRTSLLIYRLCVQGFGKDVYKDLESLLDETTPLFQSRFEQLSEQGQKLVARLARHWRAATAEKITELTGFPRSTVSPLLGRLEEDGMVEKTPLFDPGQRSNGSAKKPRLSKKIGYRLSERFFNIWIIMRSASRRERAGIMCLARFLESIYTPEELADHARNLGSKAIFDWSDAVAARALAEVFTRDGGQHDLRFRAETTLLEYARCGQQDLEGLIDVKAIDSKAHKHVELKAMLQAAVPKSAKTKPEEFADLVLGSQSILFDNGIATFVIQAVKSKRSLNIDNLANQLRGEANDLSKSIGCEAACWLQQRLRQGLLQKIDAASIEAALDSAPNAMAFQSLGELVRTESPKLAIKAYARAAELDPALSSSWAILGALYLQVNDNEQAEKSYEQAIRLGIRDDLAFSVYANYGRILLTKRERLPEAEALLRRAAEINPRNDSVANNLGVCLWLQGGKNKLEEAVIHLRRAGALNLSNPRPWMVIGQIYHHELRNPIIAETNYRKAISMTGKAPIGRTEFANLLLHKLNKADEALQQYRQAIADGANSSDCWIGLGQIMCEYKHDFVAAEQEFRIAMTKDRPAAAWTAFGEMLMKHLGNLSEAEKALREALRLDPKYGTAWQVLGWLQLAYQMSPDKALISFQKAVELNPKIAAHWNSLANLEFDFFNRIDQAEKGFLKAIELDPTQDVARHNYIFLLRDFRGDIGAAKIVQDSLQEPEYWKDSQALNEALFAAYEQNWGLTQEGLKSALATIDAMAFPKNTQDDWYRSSAVLLHLGYGQSLLDFLKAEGQDDCRMPWFEALQAHVIGDRQYLLNIPAEAQEAARMIYDQIARRLGFLPKHTSKK